MLTSPGLIPLFWENRLSILKYAYREFEDRVDQLKSPRGAKTELVEAAVKGFSGTFTLHELERACMGVSRDMVRKVLRNLQKAGFVECLGRGPGAIWQKKGNKKDVWRNQMPDISK